MRTVLKIGSALLAGGCCFCLPPVVSAKGGGPGDESAVTKAKRHLEEAEKHLERVRKAERAKLVSAAWTEGAVQESEMARLGLDLANLEVEHANGGLSDEEHALKAAEVQLKQARAQARRAKWRVEKLKLLSEVGRSGGGELSEAQAELELARLEQGLAQLEFQKADGQLAPKDYAAQYAELIRRRAELVRELAEAKLRSLRARFDIGRATAVDVLWAEMELAEARDQVRNAAIEARAALGGISSSQADAQWGVLHAKAAARRVEMLTRIATTCEKARALGLVDMDMLKSCRRDLEQAKQELADAEKKIAPADK